MNRVALSILQKHEKSALRCCNVDTKSYLLATASTLFQLDLLTPSEYVLYCEAVNDSNY